MRNGNEEVGSMVFDDSNLHNRTELSVQLHDVYSIFIPIFGLICLCNVIVHLYALITGMIKRNNTNPFRLNSFTKRGILKWIGFILIIVYGYDLNAVFKTENINGIIWNILSIVVTLFYVIWFNTYNLTWIKKEVAFN